jgi:site-specific recombinase XerD
LQALRTLKREAESPFIFVSERGAPFTVSGLAKLIERAGNAAKIGFKVHPHMLRHATGFVLANRGTDTRALQAYLRASQYPVNGALHGVGAGSL